MADNRERTAYLKTVYLRTNGARNENVLDQVKLKMEGKYILSKDPAIFNKTTTRESQQLPKKDTYN